MLDFIRSKDGVKFWRIGAAGVLFSALIVVFFVIKSTSAENPISTENSPRALVHLLDYLAQDYGGAVGENHKVISLSEYQEQLEFSETAVDLSRKVQGLQKIPSISTRIEDLHQLISKKASPGAVAALSQSIKADVIDVTHLTISPTQWPSLTHGAELFTQKCVTCHGATGEGDGPASQWLKPRPANFLDPHVMDALSPFKVFNAVRIGVPNTAMVGQTQLSDKEVWDVAFYVVSLRHQNQIENEKDKNEIAGLFDSLSKEYPLEKLSILSDSELKMSRRNLAILRLHSGSDDANNSLKTARSLLRNSFEEYKKKNAAAAKSKALMAYLEGIEPIEPRLRANDPALVSELENRMALVRFNIEAQKPVENVAAAIDAAEHQIDQAAILLNQEAPSPWLTFLIASAILLREGFEAVLIIIALLGIIRASEAHHAKKWVHGGWVAALILGLLAWFLSGWLMAITGAQRELMEGFTSLLAVVVLLYMGFWLHRTTEIGRWTKFINGKVKTALQGKNLLGLAAISFMAVFREAFECVLFLRALWLEGGDSTKSAMLAGVLGALGLIIFLAWAILRYTARIPIKRLFDFSASLMTVLAVVLVGKGLHSLQEVGLLSVMESPLNIRFDLVGFYPTLETTLAQVAILALALTLWVWGKRPSVRA